MVSFVNTNNNGKKYWEEIKALDKAMVDAGYTSKLYNKNGSLKATSTAAKGKKAKKGKFDYSKRLATSQSDFAAIRNLVKRPKYSRKKVTIS